ncbi:hypothetical protein PGB90_001582 [Kerria lacca]
MKISFIGLYRYQKHRFCKIIYSEMHCSSVVKWIKPDGDATDISVYNPIIKMKVPFITTKEKFITWYACGPTVYDSAHIGHAWYVQVNMNYYSNKYIFLLYFISKTL